MKEIHIIDKIELSDSGLVVKKSKQLAHLCQGDLDGACGVYSMMMCLIIEKIIRREVVTNVSPSLRRNTSNGRLVRFFLENQGMIVNGYELKPLVADLQSAFKKKVNAVYIEDENLLEAIIEQLNDNHPVEIGFSRLRTYGHFVVAIGYMRYDDYTDLYCLDPGYPIEKGQMWNNVLRIDTTSSAKFNCLNMRENRKVFLDEAMVCIKK